MPYKFNESRRHKISKAKYKVTNWPEYDAALIKRGSLTVWFTDEAVAAWHAPARLRRTALGSRAAVTILTSSHVTLDRFYTDKRSPPRMGHGSAPC